MRRALIVVDVQKDFLPGGALAVPDGDSIFAELDVLANSSDYVVQTRDLHPKAHCSFKEQGGEWPAHCVRETEGARFAWTPSGHIPDIISKGTSPKLEAYSGFQGLTSSGTSLNELLLYGRIDDVVIAGLALDFCVLDTAIDAARYKWPTTVVLRATKAITEEGGIEAVRRLHHDGVRVI